MITLLRVASGFLFEQTGTLDCCEAASPAVLELDQNPLVHKLASGKAFACVCDTQGVKQIVHAIDAFFATREEGLE